VNALDSAEVKQLADNFFDRKNYIQNKIVDTLKPEMIFKLDAFVQLRKEMGFIRGEYGTIKNEANILKKQIADLNHDVSEGLVDEKQFERYYSLEKTNYDQLTMATGQLTAAITEGSKKYNELLPEVDSLIAAYKESVNE
jgi:membrane-bound lytic murein transglycosylase MltF